MATKFSKFDLLDTVVAFYKDLIDVQSAEIEEERAKSESDRIKSWRDDALARLDDLHKRAFGDGVSDVELGNFEIGRYSRSDYADVSDYGRRAVDGLEYRLAQTKDRQTRAIAFVKSLKAADDGTLTLNLTDMRALGLVPYPER